MITPEQEAEIHAYTTGVLRARAEYNAHPLVAIEENWCRVCSYPREDTRCGVCRNEMNGLARRTRNREQAAAS